MAAASPNAGADAAAVSPSPGADVAAVTRSPCLVPGPDTATLPLSLWHIKLCIKLPLRCSDVSYHGAIGTRLNASNPLPLRRKDSL